MSFLYNSLLHRAVQLLLTSRRRYSFCSWDNRLMRTPEVARVRTPTCSLVCRAGNDQESWNWMWLRPSKENSGAACQSKTHKACLINSAVVGNTGGYHSEDVPFCRSTPCAERLSLCSSKVTFTNIKFLSFPSWTVCFVRLKRRDSIEISLHFVVGFKWLNLLTFSALWPRKPWVTQTAHRAPLPVTAPPFATGREHLCVDAVVVKGKAAWNSVGRFSWRAKVIELEKDADEEHLEKPQQREGNEREALSVEIIDEWEEMWLWEIAAHYQMKDASEWNVMACLMICCILSRFY